MTLKELQKKIYRIEWLEAIEKKVLDDDLPDWWDFNEHGIELVSLRNELGIEI